jgi:hypothetical protein
MSYEQQTLNQPAQRDRVLLEPNSTSTPQKILYLSFTCGSYKDNVSSSDYIVLNDGIMNEL